MATNTERTARIEQIRAGLDRLLIIDSNVERTLNYVADQLTCIKHLGTAFVIMCNDTPTKVVIGNKNLAEKIREKLREEAHGGDPVDQGIFHIEEVPWE